MKHIVRTAVLLMGAAGVSRSAQASISLLVEEPYGTWGSFNPTGHAALYLSNVCAETPVRLRPCGAGEMGVVISRYRHVGGYDWIAIPLVAYLYAVDDLADAPASVTAGKAATLRDSYRRKHLRDLVPDDPGGKMPKGDWTQLLGESFDRRIFGFQLATTPDQDARIIAQLNDSRNRMQFNVLVQNCADFSRSVLRLTYPGSIPRNAWSDVWMTTPKHLARLVQKFGERSDVDFHVFQIEQVPGTLRRSHPINGIAEGLVRTKRYFVPLVVLFPHTAMGLFAAYLTNGRFSMPKGAPLMPELAPVETGISLHDGAIDLGDFSPAVSTPRLSSEPSQIACWTQPPAVVVSELDPSITVY